MKKQFNIILMCFQICLFCSLIIGCSAKKSANEADVPMPPEVSDSYKEDINKNKSDGIQEKEIPDPKISNGDHENQKQSLSAYDKDNVDKDNPKELANILEVKTERKKNNSAVKQMRPAAIKEAARIVSFQTAMSWRYNQLLSEAERYGAILDTAFNFSPLMLTQDEAMIMPPQITRGGSSMRIEDGNTATTSKAVYELLEPARYISVVPNWREFLMADNFPKPEQPNPAVLPKNSKEKAIWQKAASEAWDQGLIEADQLFADNVSRMARSYRGVMLYHLLTAQHLLSKVNTASANLGTKISGASGNKGSKLNIGQRVYRITSPSFFIAAKSSPKKKRR